jgi:hypothetical protein
VTGMNSQTRRDATRFGQAGTERRRDGSFRGSLRQTLRELAAERFAADIPPAVACWTAPSLKKTFRPNRPRLPVEVDQHYRIVSLKQ